MEDFTSQKEIIKEDNVLPENKSDIILLVIAAVTMIGILMFLFK
ncbi:hypothetical protein N4T77_00255 [Clostridium sp. CX1]|uniref:LPXTG cell wall anchor domain-containing protein n=1 Tax=Clostridium tanneri TaxID=3037988 RepID=A0ABU4JXH0_9CLOT|nr:MULTISPECIES: hypothetical protein [unclassified Clostridium]MCT8975020.1 hypothetical protein [Clostridium sp. CX1]MDW8802604.1 hypothetical protein [Clostridium sp. A1-XYC3]